MHTVHNVGCEQNSGMVLDDAPYLNLKITKFFKKNNKV